ncbi:hypothetical protein [Listeria booriae]|uniref:hypothetical protein n=1 Tax=Listeria booriae TaxID=1552123 RepID=UPI0016236EBB|nr:hypothetical protein [Listeria booriae]MBC1228637.1 hypothetical protein [Listeria booriae]MBC1248096.1 hypothetical protein [Listeria booriae]
MNEQKAPIDKCPHCGSDEGYHTKSQVSGVVYYRHNYDGSEQENEDAYAYLRHDIGKYVYCINCEKRLFKVKEIGSEL